jgi:L-threonylcarbamoyladenylate synthase
MAILPGTDPHAIAQAAARWADGELVAFPTETVYGLGARADDDAAVARIFEAKGRPADHPLIVHVADAEGADAFCSGLSAAARRLTAAFWPGPLTVIVPRRADRGRAAAGGQDSIGLRVPAHPVALALLRAVAERGVAGVAGPSANRFGRVSPTAARHVQDEFGPGLMVIDGGRCAVGIESTIVDCTRAVPALLRPGQLSRAALEAVLGEPLSDPDAASPRASGTLASHYAPMAPVTLLDDVALRHRWAAAHPGPGAVVGVYSRLAPGWASAPGSGWACRSMPAEAAAVAHELFAVLREFDEAGVAAIWVERPPPGPEWDGVRDRLQRAAA